MESQDRKPVNKFGIRWNKKMGKNKAHTCEEIVIKWSDDKVSDEAREESWKILWKNPLSVHRPLGLYRNENVK